MSLISTKQPKQLDADTALDKAREWETKHSGVTAEQYALMSIAASLREIARKLR